MLRNSLTLSLSSAALLTATTALADVPRVVTDIAPVHALVAQVMGDLGAPDLLVDPGSSPHSYAMRPSQARALEKADLVFWIGEPLTPWLEGPLETLAAKAETLELLEAPGTIQFNFRESVVFAPAEGEEHEEHHDEHGHDEHAEGDHAEHDDHHEEHDHDDDHAHKDHDEHEHEEHEEHGHEDEHAHEKDHADEKHDEHGHDDHDEHADHDDHEEEHAGHDDHHDHAHDHDGLDPHAWLDPENGRIWLGVIADKLSALDPENAETYRANAAAGQEELAQLIGEIEAKLEPLEGQRFVVFHDAYQYFESRFHLQALGAISLGDAADPSPARISEIQSAVRVSNVTCAFSEPQFNPRLIRTVFEGVDVNTAELDPLGLAQPEGAALYPGLIRGLADAVAGCLK
ncbi:MAG: zinc ABC transporter substrate-binding protein [Pseudomonadota bacterium]|nr:zinc ABC transporter substrate-binding protein [Pseudomonadota bacterium]